MGIYNDTFDIRQLCIVLYQNIRLVKLKDNEVRSQPKPFKDTDLEGSQVQTSLFTQLSNARAVVMTEHTISKDGISNIRVSHQVDLQNLK